AIYSENATAVDLCLFEDLEGMKETRIRLTEQTDHVWYAYLPDLAPGQMYGVRAHGPYNPEDGVRVKANNLLIDAYRKGRAGLIVWSDALFGYIPGDERADLSFNEQDSGPFMPKSIVIDPSFVWGDDKPLRIPWHETIIYEVHVK